MRKRPAHIFKPWGTGIRACIGRQFALHEAVLTLASLIRRYDFAPEPGYELDVHEAITLKPRGLRVRLTGAALPRLIRRVAPLARWTAVGSSTGAG